jgi:hypothetical protein
LLMCSVRYARFMVTLPVTAGGTMVMILMMKWITTLIRPFCITILYHNLLLFIDIFHI